MKKVFLFLLSLFSTFACLAQTFQVKYDFYQNAQDHFSATVEKYLLVLTPSTSEFRLLDRKYLNTYSDSEKKEKDGSVTEKLGTQYRRSGPLKPKSYFKDYGSRTLWNNEHIQSKEYFVKDDLALMVWEITERDTLFFDKMCKIATTEHRGQTWVVFFTDAFGAMGGPWKFDGLPGLILYAENKTKNFIFQATQIEYTKETQILTNQMANAQSISWIDYTKLRKEADIRRLKNMKTASPSGPGTMGGGDKVTIKITTPPIESLGYTELSY